MYVYSYESLATTFREYKTLRMCEFYGMSDILLNPRPKQPKDQETLEAEALIEGEDVKVMRQKMADFYSAHKEQYNPSQREVLKKVAEMPENDVLLIQGPVSVKFT